MSNQPKDVNFTALAREIRQQQVQDDVNDLHTSLVDLAALVTGSRGLDELLAWSRPTQPTRFPVQMRGRDVVAGRLSGEQGAGGGGQPPVRRPRSMRSST